MGTGSSAAACEVPGSDLRLPTTGLRFTPGQLRSLNSYVDSLYEQDHIGRMSMELESSVESLVQRIVDGAGQRDPRFKCCHLIALHRGKKMRSRSLEYLVTLDALPALNSSHEACSLQEGPPGYGKVRLSGKLADQWEEFLTPGGYLCRDKVLDRWVDLIARCAHAKGGGGSRVLCARAAVHAKPYRYCYLERESPPHVSTETRLAIVEGAAWVMVRVGAGEAEAKLMLGVRGEGCCAGLRHKPLVHPMALLHYTAAQSGFYAVAVGPPSSIVCAERQATWQLWHPGLEAILDAHCSDQSTVGRIAGALNALIDRMRDGVVQGSIRVLSRYSASCALRHRLDRCGAHAQSSSRACLSAHASHHFLLVIDALISICEREAPTGYVYSVERACCTRRGARAGGAEWGADGGCLRRLLVHAHADSTAAETIPASVSESLETVMFGRWENLLRETKASSGTTPTFSRRQLKYIWKLSAELIKCKRAVENHSIFKANLIQAISLQHQPIEDLIHILAIILDQARDLYLYNNFSQPRTNDFDRNLFTYRSKKWGKLRDYYDASSACLIDAVRRDPEFRKQDLSDDVGMMRNIINWLYKGAKDDKKYLAPVLKPYLESLFLSSLENSWFLEDFEGRRCEREFEGLEEYCLRVHEGTLDPCSGLLTAAKKLAWAKAMVDFVDRARHVDIRLVFPTGDGMAVSYPAQLPSRRDRASRSLTLNRREKADAKLTLARRCVISAFNTALTGDITPIPKRINRHGSTDEILSSMKTGHYWRNSTKPDIIPSSSEQDNLPRVVRRKSRSSRSRPATSYGFPEISITSQDPKTLRKKYHTLRSLVYTEAADDMKDLKERPRSAGSTLRSKEAISRPSILETLDFITGVKEALCEESASDSEQRAWGPADDWALGQVAALNVLARLAAGGGVHLTLGNLVVALLHRGKFTILQELCTWLGDSNEGALFSLHRLARAARSRSSERSSSSWKLPEASTDLPEPTQRYSAKSPDYVSEEEAPQPPPLPRRSRELSQKRYSDYLPPKRLQDLEENIKNLELMNSKLSLDIPRTSPLNDNYTGVINPIYDVSKIPKEKFNSTKRSKSLGRSFSTKRLGLEVTRYNITLGHRNGQKTNDVVTAITGMTGETGLEPKSNFFQRYSSTASVVGDSYRVSRVTID